MRPFDNLPPTLQELESEQATGGNARQLHYERQAYDEDGNRNDTKYKGLTELETKLTLDKAEYATLYKTDKDIFERQSVIKQTNHHYDGVSTYSTTEYVRNPDKDDNEIAQEQMKRQEEEEEEIEKERDTKNFLLEQKMDSYLAKYDITEEGTKQLFKAILSSLNNYKQSVMSDDIENIAEFLAYCSLGEIMPANKLKIGISINDLKFRISSLTPLTSENIKLFYKFFIDFDTDDSYKAKTKLYETIENAKEKIKGPIATEVPIAERVISPSGFPQAQVNNSFRSRLSRFFRTRFW